MYGCSSTRFKLTLLHVRAAREFNSKVGLEMWSVLALSMLIDGYVLVKTLKGIQESKPKDVALAKHLKTVSRFVVGRVLPALCLVVL